MIDAFLCTAESMHPYECSGSGKCIHCDREKKDGHDPETCWLCHETKHPASDDPNCIMCKQVK